MQFDLMFCFSIISSFLKSDDVANASVANKFQQAKDVESYAHNGHQCTQTRLAHRSGVGKLRPAESFLVASQELEF